MPAGQKQKSPKASSEPKNIGMEPFAWLSATAFFLAITLVCVRATMIESIRDPLEVLPGVSLPPRSPGPATSLFLDLLCWIPALLVLLRRVLDRQYVIRLNWSHAVMGALGLWMMLSVNWAGDRFAALVTAANYISAF